MTEEQSALHLEETWEYEEEEADYAEDYDEGDEEHDDKDDSIEVGDEIALVNHRVLPCSLNVSQPLLTGLTHWPASSLPST